MKRKKTDNPMKIIPSKHLKNEFLFTVDQSSPHQRLQFCSRFFLLMARLNHPLDMKWNRFIKIYNNWKKEKIPLGRMNLQNRHLHQVYLKCTDDFYGERYEV